MDYEEVLEQGVYADWLVDEEDVLSGVDGAILRGYDEAIEEEVL